MSALRPIMLIPRARELLSFADKFSNLPYEFILCSNLTVAYPSFANSSTEIGRGRARRSEE